MTYIYKPDKKEKVAKATLFMLDSDTTMAKLYDSISMFYPCHNEEGNIEKSALQALKVLSKIAKKFEVILVNDGSIDKTGEIADSLAKKFKNIRVIHRKVNGGYGEALKTGFYNAKYEWIVETDADGQFDFSEVTMLLKEAERSGAQVVIGYRMNRKDPLIRKINGWGWTLLANLLLGINVRDVDCGFKLVKKEVIDKMSHLESTRGGMVNPELLAKAHKAGFKISEVGVHHFPRAHGKQTGAELKVIVKSFIDLFRLWRKLK